MWALSDIDPNAYSVGFKWTGAIKAQNSIKNPAIIINENPILEVTDEYYDKTNQ